MEERNKTDPEIAQRKIFIGGLNYSTDDEKLRKYFSTYGKVQDAVVMKDPVSRRSRGFGFITYVDLDSVDNALAHEPHTIDSRKVEAKRAVPRSENPREILVSKPTIAATVNPLSPAVKPVLDGNTNETQKSGAHGEPIPSAATNTRPSNDYTFNKIFVGGLHYDTRDADFKSYFEKFGKVVTGEVMFNRETHKSRGFGFIVFELEKSAENVCAQKEHIIDGKVVEVKRAIPRSKMLPGTKPPDSHAFGESSVPVNLNSVLSPIGTPAATISSTDETTTMSGNGNPVPANVNSNMPNPNNATRPTATVVTPLSSYAAALRANTSSASLVSIGSSTISNSAINVSPGDRDVDFNLLNLSSGSSSNDQLMAEMMGQPLTISINDSNNIISPSISRAASTSQKGLLISSPTSTRTFTDQAGNIQFMSDPHLSSNSWQPLSPTQRITSVGSIGSIGSRGSIGNSHHSQSPMSVLGLQPPSPSRTPRTGSLDNSNSYSTSTHGVGGGWSSLPSSPRQDMSQTTPASGHPSLTATSAPVHYDSYNLKCDNIYQDRSMLLFFSPRVAAERIALSSQRQYFDCVLPPNHSDNKHHSVQSSYSSNRQAYFPLNFGNSTANATNVPQQPQTQLSNDNQFSWGLPSSPSPSNSDLYLGFGSLPPPEIALTQPKSTSTTITALGSSHTGVLTLPTAGSTAPKAMAIPTLSTWSSSITLSEANSVVSNSAISPGNPNHARSPLLSSLSMSGLPLSPGPPSSRDPWASVGTGAGTSLPGISMTISRDAAGSFDATDNLSNLSSSHNGKADILNFQDFGLGSPLASELRPNSAEWTPSRSLKSSRG